MSRSDVRFDVGKWDRTFQWLPFSLPLCWLLLSGMLSLLSQRAQPSLGIASSSPVCCSINSQTEHNWHFFRVCVFGGHFAVREESLQPVPFSVHRQVCCWCWCWCFLCWEQLWVDLPFQERTLPSSKWCCLSSAETQCSGMVTETCLPPAAFDLPTLLLFTRV